MPPLETDIAVETEERVRFDHRVTQELKDLCSLIKRLVSECLERREREITEMCKPDRSQNRITEVNAKQEKHAEKKEK